MKKIFLIVFLTSLIFLAGCGKKQQISETGKISSTKIVDITQNIKPSTNIQNIEIIPLENIEKTDCEKYGGNENLKMADPACSGLVDITSNPSQNGYVVGESNFPSENQKPQKSAKLIEIKNEAGEKGKPVAFGENKRKNSFYHPDKTPVYGPGIHVNHENANLKMGYGPYETYY